MVGRWLQPPGADLLSWLWAWRSPSLTKVPLGTPPDGLGGPPSEGRIAKLRRNSGLRLPQIFYLLYLEYLQLDPIRLTLELQSSLSILSCHARRDIINSSYNRGLDRLEGGCASITSRDSYGIPIQWTIKKASKTDRHDKYFNCIGADADFGSCCSPGSIVVPRNPQQPVMTLDGYSSYPNICSDARAFDVALGDPKDCMKS
ncbi:hypothetical protein H4Q26_009536 [Puccinia striiformis f. sp. tritici PST-130]|uniref:Uncharacterized protein n=1 Tax=Puccinia striiformis f. sp. tritici PST-78 TaxID=1165861 RepID=A0A0L0VI57_9BASI|nr:hypothetical protein H4Q26_009536 [Puccinia striiformis f. sp. tritici PST-130]KNE98911.1 hypothetical protein PSTG_07756 [Puccinia striiformis f. sp. tritici PST-78]